MPWTRISTDPYVYLFYAYDAPPGGTAPTWGIAGRPPTDAPTRRTGREQRGRVRCRGRISRLQIAGEVRAAPSRCSSRWQAASSTRVTSAGLEFGADGNLYYSGGDGAAWHFTDYGQKGQP